MYSRLDNIPILDLPIVVPLHSTPPNAPPICCGVIRGNVRAAVLAAPAFLVRLLRDREAVKRRCVRPGKGRCFKVHRMNERTSIQALADGAVAIRTQDGRCGKGKRRFAAETASFHDNFVGYWGFLRIEHIIGR